MRTDLAVFLAALVTAAGSASAALIAGDAYVANTSPDPAAGEYQSSTTAAANALKNQSASLVTPGFTTGPYGSGTGTSNFGATLNGLESPILGSTSAASGKVSLLPPGVDTQNRSNARILSPTLTGNGTYWLSYVVNRGSIDTSGGTGWAFVGFGNTTVPDLTSTGTLAGFFVGFAQDGVAGNFGNLVIRSRNTTSTTANTDTVLVNGATASTVDTTYTVIIKVGINAISGNQEDVKWWLNPADGTSEATLDSSAAATGAFTSFALQSAGDFARLYYTTRSWNAPVHFDEPRLANDFAGLGLAVPEPASLSLGGGGALLLLARRRRNSV